MTAQTLLRLHQLGFTFDSASRDLFTQLDVTFNRGFTGVVGRNGSGKTTLLRLIAGELRPATGRVERRGELAVCRQETHSPPATAGALLAAIDAEACRLRGMLRIEADWLDRFATLSHGERKRLQLASALWPRPAILLVDEPTNHLDAGASDLVLSALNSHRGIGLIVSHDRELLDRLCQACLFLGDGRATLRPGNYQAGCAEALRENLAATREHDQVTQDLRRLEQEAVRRREDARGAARRLSKRNLDRHDADGRAKIDAARVSGRDTAAGRRLRQLDGHVQRTRDRLAAAPRPRGERLGIRWSAMPSRRDALLRLPAGHLPLGDGRVLELPALHIGARDRIAITGDNGAGKSTLFRHLLGALDLPADERVVLPQEIRADAALDLVRDARRLPRDARAVLLSTVQRLGAEPRRLLETDQPSPGELRKLLIALGCARGTSLVAMDEPTNHLDLPSIECLQAALADYSGALLIVGHDRPFLAALAQTRWHIAHHRVTITAMPGAD